jgi:hypothetical protein
MSRSESNPKRVQKAQPQPQQGLFFINSLKSPQGWAGG